MIPGSLAAVLSLGLALSVGGCGNTMAELPSGLEAGYAAQRSYDDGLDRYKAGDYAGAIPLFQRALQLKPDFADARAGLLQAGR